MSSDMDLETQSHDRIMAAFHVPVHRDRDEDTESVHSMRSSHSLQSDNMSIQSTHSESRQLMNDLKSKLNQQKSVWTDIKSKTNKYIELYLLNNVKPQSEDLKAVNNENDETQSLYSANNEMDDKQKRLYIRLQNNLIADLMKQKNELNGQFVAVKEENGQNVKTVEMLRKDIVDKSKMIEDYKQLLSNTVHDMNRQNELQNEITLLTQKMALKDTQISASEKAFAAISNHLTEYINHIESTTNYLNYKITKMSQHIGKIERKHHILLSFKEEHKSSDELKQSQHRNGVLTEQLKERETQNESLTETIQRKVDTIKLRDEMIQELIRQKMRLIQETAKTFNEQRNVISLYQKERVKSNWNIRRKSMEYRRHSART